jgi:aspartyl-tRNA(Asn)/glutamyl-tRNA(Gln) amidotransferase subunit C
MKLEKKDIKHIADLARLELSEAELDLYGSQLSGVLDYIDQLQEVDTEGVEPTAQVTGLLNVLRSDKIKDWEASERQAALAQAPAFEDEQYRVGRVLNNN